MLAQICADALGMDMADVTVVTADTAGVEFGIGTFGSRITVNAGSSVHVAAGKVREKALKIASHLLAAAAEDLDIADGRIDRKSTRLNSSHSCAARMPSSA